MKKVIEIKIRPLTEEQKEFIKKDFKREYCDFSIESDITLNFVPKQGCLEQNIIEIINNYKTMENLTFGQALEALKLGEKVARKGWNGSGMFAVLSPGKKALEAEGFFNQDLKEHALKIGGTMDVRPAFMLKTAQDDVAYWVPSGSDCLAEDWLIIL